MRTGCDMAAKRGKMSGRSLASFDDAVWTVLVTSRKHSTCRVLPPDELSRVDSSGSVAWRKFIPWTLMLKWRKFFPFRLSLEMASWVAVVVCCLRTEYWSSTSAMVQLIVPAIDVIQQCIVPAMAQRRWTGCFSVPCWRRQVAYGLRWAPWTLLTEQVELATSVSAYKAPCQDC